MFNLFSPYELPPFDTIIRNYLLPHLIMISYFSYLPSNFISMEQMSMVFLYTNSFTL